MLAWRAYDICCKFQEALDIYQEQGLEEAVEYIVIEVGKEVAFILLAAGAGKLIGELATSPAAKRLFKGLQRRLKNDVNKVAPGLTKKIGEGIKKSKNFGKKLEKKFKGLTTGKKALKGLSFGSNNNQIYHTFRHTDKLKLPRSKVQSAITSHLSNIANKIEAGKHFNQIIEVNGHKIQYTAYKLKDGIINIGRIHGV